jgi:hypothetical protein
MVPIHASTLLDDELLRLPVISVPPEDPDPLYWPWGGVVWVVGYHRGRVMVRGPARADDPLLER